MSAMADLNATATERVTDMLAAQVSAHERVASLHLEGKVTDDNRRSSTEHTEIARLFTLLLADVRAGRLDHLQRVNGAFADLVKATDGAS